MLKTLNRVSAKIVSTYASKKKRGRGREHLLMFCFGNWVAVLGRTNICGNWFWGYEWEIIVTDLRDMDDKL